MEDWELDFHWLKARHQIKDFMNQEKLPDLNMVLLLIGIRELGKVKKNTVRRKNRI